MSEISPATRPYLFSNHSWDSWALAVIETALRRHQPEADETVLGAKIIVSRLENGGFGITVEVGEDRHHVQASGG